MPADELQAPSPLRKAKSKRRYVRWIAAALLVCLALTGWKLASVLGKSTAQFVPYSGDPRVLYEPGAEALAKTVAEALPEAIQTVEQQHYQPFAKPVRVYVCARVETLEAYGFNVRHAAGFVLNQRLFISSKPENTAERMPRLVTHELSHLHLEQRLGMLHCCSALPPWFQEGLAVHLSGGGGAEKVSEQEARQSIASGRHFLPAKTGSLFFRQGATAYGLEHHMFYRQSALFIAHLRNKDEAHFKAFLLSIQDGHSLETSFTTAYGQSLDTLWQQFLAEVSKPN